jgi:hypothetical protein
MPREKEDRKAEIVAAIHEHLKIEGPQNWDKLLKAYPSVSRPTLFRYIKEVRESIEKSAAEYGSGHLRLAQQQITQRVETPEQTQKKIKAHLPTAPSPAVVAAAPADCISSFNFFAFFNKIISDLELARGSTVKKNEDGTERVLNPAMLDRNLGRRLQALETYLHSIETVYNLERIRELYELIIDEVGKADPDIQRAVLVRLRELDNKRGITMSARIA